MLFFDLEFYVPPDDRTQGLSSLIFNPARPSHLLLGGSFWRKPLGAPVPPPQEPLDIAGRWLWDIGSEAELLVEIKRLFEDAWSETRAEGAWVLGKPVHELVVCGAGISKVDLPALYCRGVLHAVASPGELFEVFLKPRPVDLANTASFLFPEDQTLYPKTTKEMAGRVGVGERKGSSKGVWDLYEARDHAAIERRTRDELTTIIEVYRRIQKRISTGTVSRGGGGGGGQ